LSTSAKALVLAARGGNVAVSADAACELRIRLGLLAAAPPCSQFGLASAIHGCDIETALMLELRPARVHRVIAGSISMPKAPPAMPHRPEAVGPPATNPAVSPPGCAT
jgi:creatinine amidohydrolase/Fe(II)-dependent formamide hydrolase-like protein